MQPDHHQRAVIVFTTAVDRVTVMIVDLLREVGIETIVLKGPTFARWLYLDGERVYGDADIMVDPLQWDLAITTLRALGFVDSLTDMAHPRMQSQRSWGLSRGFEQVDLHASLSGLQAPADRIWGTLRSHAEPFELDGTTLLALDEVARTMHVALHAAHHMDASKPQEDLARALTAVGHTTWGAARDLAFELSGGPAFAAGLRTVPQGAELAQRIGVHDLRSATYEIRSARVPVAEALNDLIVARGARDRMRILRAELFPNAAFMRWNHPVARRGRRGLAVSYALRWSWLATHLPRGIAAVAGARRRVDRHPPG